MNEFMSLFTPLMNNFLRPHTIRRIDDGRRASKAEFNSLQGLSEQVLRDLGYTASSR
jgi:hypothetical protein